MTVDVFALGALFGSLYFLAGVFIVCSWARSRYYLDDPRASLGGSILLWLMGASVAIVTGLWVGRWPAIWSLLILGALAWFSRCWIDWRISRAIRRI